MKEKPPRFSWTIRLVAVGLLLLPALSLVADDAPAIAAGALPAAVVEAIPVALNAIAKQKLLAAGSYSTFSRGQVKVDLCPNPAAAAAITRALQASPPSIGIQTLVAAAMPAGLLARPDRDLVFYNLIHQFRSMEGLQYFSSTRGKTRTLFTTSHLVKGPGNRLLLGDPHYPSIEASHDLFLEQDDSTFGKNLYAVSVKGFDGGAVGFTMSNVETVWYGFLPLLEPGALKLTLVIQASVDGKYLYFYGNVGISATKVLGMQEQVRTSFYNRIIALYNWFAKQAAQAG
jgi:hypothetical protein